jgi:hypothetical protein
MVVISDNLKAGICFCIRSASFVLGENKSSAGTSQCTIIQYVQMAATSSRTKPEPYLDTPTTKAVCVPTRIIRVRTGFQQQTESSITDVNKVLRS